VGSWSHVALTYDGKNLSLYVNGVLDAQEPRSGTIGDMQAGEDVLLGALSGEGKVVGHLFGRVDEAVILKISRDPREFALQLPPVSPAAVPAPESIVLTWQNGGGAAPLMRYRIYRGADSASLSLWDSSSATSYVDSNVTPFVRYSYRISAVDSSGFEGAPSALAAASPSIGVPTLLSPTAGAFDIPPDPVLTWSSVRLADLYQVQVWADSLLTIPVEDTTLADTMVVVRELAGGLRYWWRVRASGQSVWGPYGEVQYFDAAVLTDADEEGGLPREFGLSQNYPNPFNPSTEIRFQLPEETRVRLSIYDLLGREVATVADGSMRAGRHSVVWDAAGVASGFYLYRLVAGPFVATKRMMLLR
jgi:hypothetical protein